MKTFRASIPLKPKPKASVQMSRKKFYNPCAQGMAEFARHAKKAQEEALLSKLTGPLLMIVHSRIPLRKSIQGSNRKKRHLLPHDKRPDIDNLQKFINDSLNGICFEDDGQIVWLLASKTFTADKEGSTELFLAELPTALPDYELLLRLISENIRIGEPCTSP